MVILKDICYEGLVHTVMEAKKAFDLWSRETRNMDSEKFYFLFILFGLSTLKKVILDIQMLIFLIQMLIPRDTFTDTPQNNGLLVYRTTQHPLAQSG